MPDVVDNEFSEWDEVVQADGPRPSYRNADVISGLNDEAYLVTVDVAFTGADGGGK